MQPPRRTLLLAMTLLTMLSQILLPNNSVMIANAMATEIVEPQPHRDAKVNQASSHHCDDELMTPKTSTNQHDCCEKESCQDGCKHCVFISISCTLFSNQNWHAVNDNALMLSTAAATFNSVSLPQDIRPPIA